MMIITGKAPSCANCKMAKEKKCSISGRIIAEGETLCHILENPAPRIRRIKEVKQKIEADLLDVKAKLAFLVLFDTWQKLELREKGREGVSTDAPSHPLPEMSGVVEQDV